MSFKFKLGFWVCICLYMHCICCLCGCMHQIHVVEVHIATRYGLCIVVLWLISKCGCMSGCLSHFVESVVACGDTDCYVLNPLILKWYDEEIWDPFNHHHLMSKTTSAFDAWLTKLPSCIWCMIDNTWHLSWRIHDQNSIVKKIIIRKLQWNPTFCYISSSKTCWMFLLVYSWRYF